MKWVVLIVNCLSVMMLSLGNTAVMTIIPSIQESLHLSANLARWIINGYIVVGLLVILIGGCLGDRWGHFRLLFYAMSLFAALGMLFASSYSGTWMVIFRSLQGGCAATISTLSLASISLIFPPPQRALVISILGGASGLGFGLGPLLGGVMAQFFNWRYLFLVISCFLACAAAANLLFFRLFTTPRNKTPIDVLSLSFFVGWLTSTIFWLMEGERIGWFSQTGAGLLVLSFVLLGVLLRSLKKSPHPLFDSSFVKNKQLRASVVMYFCIVFSLISFLFFYSRFLQWPLIHHATPAQAGLFIFPCTFTLFLTALCSSAIRKIIGDYPTLFCGLSCVVVGFILIALLPIQSPLIVRLAPLMLLGLGFGLTFPVAPHVGLKSLPDALYGKGAGLLNTVNSLGGSLAIAVGSVLYLKMANKTLFYMDIFTIDRLLFGSSKELFDWIGQRSSFGDMQQAVITSFSYLVLFAAFIAAVGLLATTWLKRKN